MIKLFLVRHGEATHGWTSKDPPLSDLGKSQALSLAPFIDKVDLNKVDLVSSPLTRCKETANLALSKHKQEVEINDIFRELPSPITDLEKRVIWLRRVLPLTWPELLSDEETVASGVDLNKWREKIIDKINYVELSCKKNPQISKFIFFNFLTDICKKASSFS